MEKEVEYAWDNYTVNWLKPCWHHVIQDTMIMRKAFKSQVKIKCITIRCRFFSLFIGREPTTWPTSNCLQIMVYSNAMSFNCVCLQMILCSRHAITLSWKWQLVEDISDIYKKKRNLATEWWNNYGTRLSQNVSRVLSVESRSIIHLGLDIRLRQIIDLLATDKTRYFAQPCAITFNYIIDWNKVELSRFWNLAS